LQQRDLDARWVKQNDINHYGYKNSICIDAEYGFIRRFVVTPANFDDDYVWADSAYSGEHFKDILSLGGCENRIHEKGSRNHPLSAAATERNSIRSQIRARVEYVFGFFATSMGGKFTRKIGLKRNKAWWSLKNLTFNFLRYLHDSGNSLVSI
jgi:transposase, IS5 family